MKKLLSIIFLFISLNSWATNYYVASNGLNSNSGLIGFPWQTIAKVNAVATSGDVVYFNRGDVFDGAIIPKANSITYDAYGTGAQPIINGFTLATAWRSTGLSGIYATYIGNTSNTINFVLINGVEQRMGRYPNYSTSTEGWLSYESHNTSGNPSITDNQLPTTPNWTGADLVVKKLKYVIEHSTIISQVAAPSGSTITATSPLNREGNSDGIYGTNNYGYFIQNDIRTLDQLGEWYAKPSVDSLYMYFGSNSPTSYTVKIAVQDTLMNCGGGGFGNRTNRATRTGIIVQNLHFTGANDYGIYSFNGSTTVNNNTVDFARNGIFLWNNPTPSITNNTVTDILNNGIMGLNGDTTSNTLTITGNIVKRVGLTEGAGDNGYLGALVGIQTNGYSQTLIQNNTIDSTGYHGIYFIGKKSNVLNNGITNYLIKSDDGGGIYTFQNYSVFGSVINGNVLSGGIGNIKARLQDTEATAFGIYLDGVSKYITVLNNSVSNNKQADFFMNSGVNNTVRDNTFYNSPYSIYLNRFAGDVRLSGNQIKHNVSYPTVSDLFFNESELDNPSLITIQSDILGIGNFDSSYYNTNLPAPFDWWYHTNSGASFFDPASQNLSQWQSYTGFDAHATALSTAPVLYTTNPTTGAVATNFSGSVYSEPDGTTHNNSITLSPWSGKLLSYVGSSTNASPTANAGANKAITLPTNSMLNLGGGIDADGTITGYAWTKLSGPTGDNILNPRRDSTTITFSSAGTYQYVLTVTDNNNATGLDTMQVVVSDALRIAPTAIAGSDQTIQLPVNQVALSGSFTGNPSLVQWNTISGPAGNYYDAYQSLQTNFLALVQGTYTVQFTVIDFNGLRATDTVVITVAAPIANIPPVANAGGNKSITLPVNSVVLTGSGSDVDGTIDPAGYLWVVYSGPTGSTNSTPTATTTTIGNLTQGVYTVSFQVKDNSGAFGYNTMQITVNPAIPPINTPPVANAGADTTLVLPTNSKTLNGSGTDADGTISSYLWRQISGPNTGTFGSTSNKNSTFSGLIAGTYVLTLRVTDNSGDTAVDNVQIRVNPAPVNNPPVANAGADTVLILSTSSMTFYNTSATDVEGSVTIIWTQISGPKSTTITGSTTLNPGVSGLTTTGKYVYNMKVTDAANAFTNDSKQVTVLDATCNCIITKAGRRKITQ